MATNLTIKSQVAAIKALPGYGDACKVFTDADNSSASFAARLAELGIADRATARPLALVWAAEKYDAKLEEGQRGLRLPRDSAAEKAAQRVLQVCFPSADLPAGRNVSRQADPVEKMASAFAKLDKAEQRRFLRLIGQ